MIPNIFHFIFGLEKDFGGKPFSVAHYLSIKSVATVNRPDRIFLYYKYEPSGYWWDKAKKLVELVQISVPRKIFGNKLHHFAHKTDVLRLLILNKFGGVYLDLDTLFIRPITPLLNYDCVMAQENYRGNIQGLCNAVILASSNNTFIQYWLSTYKYFRSTGHDSFWGEHSIKIPFALSKEYPALIHVEGSESFFNPSYATEDLSQLFEKHEKFPNAYLFHLWESFSYDRYLRLLSEEYIQNVDTTYNVVARIFL